MNLRGRSSNNTQGNPTPSNQQIEQTGQNEQPRTQPLLPPPPPPQYATTQTVDALAESVQEIRRMMTQLIQQQTVMQQQLNNNNSQQQQRSHQSQREQDDQSVYGEDDEDDETYHLSNSRTLSRTRTVTLEDESSFRHTDSLSRDASRSQSVKGNIKTVNHDTIHDKGLAAVMKRLSIVEQGKAAGLNDRPYKPPPFTKEVMAVPIPKEIPTHKLDQFDGTADPYQHVGKFQTYMDLYNLEDAVRCRIFPTTLRALALQWYQSLEPGKFSNFEELTNAFTQQFVASRKRKKPCMHLMSVQQLEGESLKDYAKRFGEAILETDDINIHTVAGALSHGTRCKRLRKSLLAKAPSSMEDIMRRTDKCVQYEESLGPDLIPHGNTSKRPDDRHNEDRGSNKSARRQRDRSPNRDSKRRRERNYTKLTASPSEVLRQAQKDGLLTHAPYPMAGDASKRDQRLYCDYHRERGHVTDDCRVLRNAIEKLLNEGRLRNFIAEDDSRQHDGNRTNDRREGRRDDDRGKQKIIH